MRWIRMKVCSGVVPRLLLINFTVECPKVGSNKIVEEESCEV
jgi:hypothetical protein